MSVLDFKIREVFAYYGRPDWEHLPDSEKMFIATSIVKEEQREADIWCDELGVKTAHKMMHLAGAGDRDAECGRIYREFLLAATKAREAYERASTEVAAEEREAAWT